MKYDSLINLLLFPSPIIANIKILFRTPSTDKLYDDIRRCRYALIMYNTIIHYNRLLVINYYVISGN